MKQSIVAGPISRRIISISTLRLLGTGTSQGVPVIGCNCEVCTSADPRDRRLRTSALLTHADKHFVIDAGPDFREQLLQTSVAEIEGVLITHEHYDHTSGLDDLRPLIFRAGRDMPVYCLPRVAKEIRERFAYAFTDYPGVPKFDLREVTFEDTIDFNGTEIKLLEVQHGKIPIFGFRWGDLAYLTDVKELGARTLVQCKGVNTAIISSLHREGTHSHLSLDESLYYLAKLEAKNGILFHFSHRMGRVAELNPTLPNNVECGYDGMLIVVAHPRGRSGLRPSLTPG